MSLSFTIDLGQGAVALPYGPFRDAEGVSHSVQVLDLWSENELADIGVTRTEVAASAPSEVTRLGFRLALAQSGLLEDLEAAVASSAVATEIYWADVRQLHRDNPVLLAIAEALDPPISSEALDDLFTLAATLDA